MTFASGQLTLARMRRGLKKADLADLLEVWPKSVTEWEEDRVVPREDMVARISNALRFPIAFFEGPTLEIPRNEAVSFRSLTSMKAGQRDAVLASGALAFAASRWIEARFDLPANGLPNLQGMAPDDAAEAVRDRFSLGLQSVHSMVHLLELHGVRVYSLAERCREVDAFSLWHGSTPFCFLNTTKSVEHGRFDAAHELGHLVLHRHGAPTGRAAEREADAFASAFLMPRATVRARIARGVDMAGLMAAKSEWGVSLAALAHRAHKLEMLSDWLYRSTCIAMGDLGYRTTEPHPMATREASQILKKVFSALKEDGLSKADVARELRIYVHDLDAIMFGLVMTGVEGNRSTIAHSQSPRPQLRLL